MGYYDSVKDSVKNNERGANSAKGGNFDTLKQNAEQNTKSDEEKGDDTPIEVVEEGGISEETPSKSNNSQQQKSQTSSDNNDSSSDNPFTSKADSTDVSGLESKLDKLIEQNERMIEILESFGS